MAVSLIIEKKFQAAMKQLLASFRAWPLIALDLFGIVLAIKELSNRNNSEVIFPNLEKPEPKDRL